MSKQFSSLAFSACTVTALLLGLQVHYSEAHAGELKPQSKISTVTVFPQGAQVARTIDINLEAGQHTLTLTDLPAQILPDSIQVEGQAEGKLEIGTIDIQTIYISPKQQGDVLDQSQREKLEKEIEKLTDEKNAFEAIIQSAQMQQTYIQELAQLPSRPIKSSNTQGEHAPIDWSGLFDLIGNKSLDLKKRSLEASIKIREINDKIEDLNKKLQTEPPAQEERTQVKINVNADSALKANLKIQYQTPLASWEPLYEARLDTKDGPEKAKLAIKRRAAVTQTSGEDWNNVSLTLSTTRPSRGTAAAKLTPQKIAIQEYDKRDQMSSNGYSRNRVAAPKGAEEQFGNSNDRAFLEKEAKLAKPAPVQALEPGTQIREGAFHALFDVPEKVSLKTSEGMKKLTISTIDITPHLKAIAVPKKSLTAYLSAKFIMPKAAPVLAGQVSLYRDGVFIGHGVLPDLNTGAEHGLGFGADEAIQVKRAEVSRSKGETGLITSSKTDERLYKITVKNLHGWKIPVTIVDQIPFADNDKIKIEQLSQTTPPSRQNVDDERGILAWDVDLSAGQEHEVNLAYKITWPKDQQISIGGE